MIAFLALVPTSAQGGQNADSPQHYDSSAQKKPNKPPSILGKVGSDGKTFTADKDSKIWKVNNPEAFSGIEGRHAKVKALVHAPQNQIQILAVHTFPKHTPAVSLP